MTRLSLALIVACSLVLTACPGTTAEAPTPMDRFLEESGIRAMIEGQLATQRQQTDAQVEQMRVRIRSQLPNLPPDKGEEIDKLAASMAEAIGNAYTLDDILEGYAAPFEAAYPGDEIEQLIAQVSSPEGRKLFDTINQAVTQVYQMTARRHQQAMSQETRKFAEAIQKMAPDPAE